MEREREGDMKIGHEVLKTGPGNRRESIKEREKKRQKRGDNEMGLGKEGEN